MYFQVGDVTILINNAGIVTGKKILECPDELMQRTVDVGLTAFFVYRRIVLLFMFYNI